MSEAEIERRKGRTYEYEKRLAYFVKELTKDKPRQVVAVFDLNGEDYFEPNDVVPAFTKHGYEAASIALRGSGHAYGGTCYILFTKK